MEQIELPRATTREIGDSNQRFRSALLKLRKFVDSLDQDTEEGRKFVPLVDRVGKVKENYLKL